MSLIKPNNATTIEKFFFDLGGSKIESSINYQEYFSQQNILYFVIALVLVSIAITLFCYLILGFFHLIRVSFDKISKKTYFLKISFNKQINYDNASYLQAMDNLFKRLEQIIRVGGHSVSFQTHKEDDYISFLVSCSNKKTIEAIRGQLKSIEGIKIDETQTIQALPVDKKAKIKKIFYKQDKIPISFKTQNVFSDIVKLLENSQSKSGCIVMFRTSKARNRLIGHKKHFDRLSKDPKRNDQYINQEKSKLIEDKISHGELFNAKIYVYSDDLGVVENLASCFAQSNLNNEIRSVNVFLTLEKNNINKRYIAPEFVALRLLLGYSYLSSYELAHIIRPVFSNQMRLIDQNIVTVPNAELEGEGEEGIERKQTDLLLLNSKGDSITIEDSKNGIGIFGDKGSGKTSGALGNLIISSFNNGEGALFTIYKDEEVYPILKLAKQKNRTDDVILLSRNSLWRTNIINQEIKETKSITNGIELMLKINRIVNNTSPNSRSSDPFWDNASKDLFTNLMKLTVHIYGTFSFSVFDYLSELASESARYIETVVTINLNTDQEAVRREQEQKKIIFDKLLKQLELSISDEVSDETINDLNTQVKDKLDITTRNKSDISNVIKYFKVDWLGIEGKTRESIYAVFRSSVSAISSGIISKLLIADVDSSYPYYFSFSDTRKGKIIILDEAVSKTGFEGRVFQKVIKSFWIDQVKRNKEGRNCNLISDEYQEFVTEDDIDFLNVSRSYGVGVIWATQNIATLEAKHSIERTKQLLANTQVKIFFQTSDKSTWQFARELLGEVNSNNYTEQYDHKLGTSTSSSQKYELLGKDFQQLSMNSKPSQTEAIIFNKGYNFKDDKKPYLQVIFDKVDRVFADEIESIIPKFEQVNLPTIDAAKVVKNLLISGGFSKADLELKVVESKPKLIKKVIKKEEIENVSEVEFLSIPDLVYKFNIAERTLRQKIKEVKIAVETKDIKSTSGQKIKVYNVDDIAKIVAIPVKELKLKNDLTP